MKILITGNMGYVGCRVVRMLMNVYPNLQITGYDTGYFAHCLTGAARLPEARIHNQLFGDMRNFDPEILCGMDAVIHLAAISNDPMGKQYEEVTLDINYKCSVMLAEAARDKGVRNFVFASSCSMYGFSEGGARKETDELNPLTAYARSKVATEKGIAHLASDDFIVTNLRFATACGMSERLRLDLVLNDFVAGAVASQHIDILSDGSPWRPLISVDDMALAMSWAIKREARNGGNCLSVNTGSNEWNCQVKDLAEAVAEVIGGTRISVNENAMPDKRSYRVNFDLYKELAPQFVPRVSLKDAIGGLHEGIVRINFSDESFRDSNYMRLKVLSSHVSSKALTNDLYWA